MNSKPMGPATTCPRCPAQPGCEWPLVYMDYFVVILSVGSTATFIVFVYITYKVYFKPDTSEFVDPYEITMPIAKKYVQNISKKIMDYKKKRNFKYETFPEMYCRYFMDLYERDSAAACTPGKSTIVEEHEKFQRIKTPLVLHTRVKLVDHDDRFEDDYVHANYVDYPNGLRLIMTPGPQAADYDRKSDIERFWWIAKQEKVEKIVMLCQFYENEGYQCDQYYPEEEDEYMEFDGLTVSCVAKRIDFRGQIVIRRFCVQFSGHSKFYVTHYQYVEWHEHGSPRNLNMVYALLDEIRTSCKPVMVHCSDGLGRTGCFGFIEMAWQLLTRKKEFDLGDILDLMRSKRAGVVLNGKQYALCAHMAIHIWDCKGYRLESMVHDLINGYDEWDHNEYKIRDDKIEEEKQKELEKAKAKIEPKPKTKKSNKPSTDGKGVELPVKKVEPAKAEPAKVEPTKVEPTKKVEPAKADPTKKTEPIKEAEPMKTAKSARKTEKATKGNSSKKTKLTPTEPSKKAEPPKEAEPVKEAEPMKTAKSLKKP